MRPLTNQTFSPGILSLMPGTLPSELPLAVPAPPRLEDAPRVPFQVPSTVSHCEKVFGANAFAPLMKTSLQNSPAMTVKVRKAKIETPEPLKIEIPIVTERLWSPEESPLGPPLSSSEASTSELKRPTVLQPKSPEIKQPGQEHDTVQSLCRDTSTNVEFPLQRRRRRLDRQLAEEDLHVEFMNLAMMPIRQAIITEIDRRQIGQRRVYYSEVLPDFARPHSIDFSKGMYPEGQRLTMPQETMQLDELFARIDALHVIMQRCESIYQATGWVSPASTDDQAGSTAIYELDYVAHARQNMTRDEVAAFERYLTGKLPLPEWADIEAASDRITRAPPRNLEEFGDLLRFLYQRPVISDDAKMFMRRYPRYIPLLFALQKVVSAGVTFAGRVFASEELAKEFRCREEVRRLTCWALSVYQKNQEEIIKNKNALLESIKEQVSCAERTERLFYR